MFNRILIVNRGDQRRSRAAAKLNCVVRAAHTGGFAAMEVQHV
jgi:hypothetical protein